MDNVSLQNLLKRLCKVMWEANVTNPITYVTQISYLIFLKMLEEMDAELAEFGVPPSGGGARLSPTAADTNAARAAGRGTRAPAEPAKAGTPNGGKRQPIFTKVKIAGDTVDFGKLQWSVLQSVCRSFVWAISVGGEFRFKI